MLHSLPIRNRNTRYPEQFTLTHLVARSSLVVVRLVKEEVGGKLFVLVAGEVGLNGLVSVEAEAAQLQLG